MKLLGRKKEVGTAAEVGEADPADENATSEAEPVGGARTAPKGRPTPKRSEATKKRGPVAPAPMTTAEARARRKVMAGPKPTREESRAAKAQRRQRMEARRQRVLAGDEDALPPRDQGPVRRYVRDLVDARRNALGLMMPLTLTVLFFSMAIPALQIYVMLGLLVLTTVLMLDGMFLARKVNRLADAKFPDNVESHWKLGVYAVGRASQLRRTRIPRPQVKRGERVE